jgi:hypothetical protein
MQAYPERDATHGKLKKKNRKMARKLPAGLLHTSELGWEGCPKKTPPKWSARRCLNQFGIVHLNSMHRSIVIDSMWGRYMATYEERYQAHPVGNMIPGAAAGPRTMGAPSISGTYLSLYMFQSLCTVTIPLPLPTGVNKCATRKRTDLLRGVGLTPKCC